LVEAGYVVVAAGGGGIPVVRDGEGPEAPGVHGVEAVVDKDLTAVLLAREVGCEQLVIATDVENAYLGYGGGTPRALGRVGVERMRAHLDRGEFGGGSMAPKAEAACRFVEGGGRRAVIAALDRIREAVAGESGTVVEKNDGLKNDGLKNDEQENRSA
jgi:carbamate kinase